MPPNPQAKKPTAAQEVIDLISDDSDDGAPKPAAIKKSPSKSQRSRPSHKAAVKEVIEILDSSDDNRPVPAPAKASLSRSQPGHPAHPVSKSSSVNSRRSLEVQKGKIAMPQIATQNTKKPAASASAVAGSSHSHPSRSDSRPGTIKSGLHSLDSRRLSSSQTSLAPPTPAAIGSSSKTSIGYASQPSAARSAPESQDAKFLKPVNPSTSLNSQSSVVQKTAEAQPMKPSPGHIARSSATRIDISKTSASGPSHRHVPQPPVIKKKVADLSATNVSADRVPSSPVTTKQSTGSCIKPSNVNPLSAGRRYSGNLSSNVSKESVAEKRSTVEPSLRTEIVAKPSVAEEEPMEPSISEIPSTRVPQSIPLPNKPAPNLPNVEEAVDQEMSDIYDASPERPRAHQIVSKRRNRVSHIVEDDEDDNASEVSESAKNEAPSKSSSSVGTSPPLITRLKQQRTRKQAFKVEEFAPFLLKCREEMEEEHAKFAFVELMHAADEVDSFKDEAAKFMDEVSPWDALRARRAQGLEPGPGPGPGPGCKITSMSRSLKLPNHPSSLRKIQRTIPTKQIYPDQSRIPTYSAYTHTTRNILTADEDRLRFLPYMGDADKIYKRLESELGDAYKGNMTMESSRQKEQRYTIRSFLGRWLDELGPGFDLATLELFFLKFHLDETDTPKIEIPDAFASILLNASTVDPKTWLLCRSFSLAFLKVFDDSLKHVVLTKERQAELVEHAKSIADLDLDIDDAQEPSKHYERLGTYTYLNCLICGVDGCITHGDYIKDQRHQQGLTLDFDNTMRKQEMRIGNQREPDPGKSLYSPQKPCSLDCWHTGKSEPNGLEIPEEQQQTIEHMLFATWEDPDRSCHIAQRTSLPCWCVHDIINHMPYREGKPQMVDQRERRPKYYNNEKKTLKDNWRDEIDAHDNTKTEQYSPCAHEGPCDLSSDCHCYHHKVLCERFCGCADDCTRRWTGCHCKSSSAATSCQSDTCICIQMNRECGPECGSCGARVRINPTNRYNDILFTSGCQNCYLQRGVHKRLIIGESQIDGAGFGAYAAEPINKNEWFAEYVGEVN